MRTIGEVKDSGGGEKPAPAEKTPIHNRKKGGAIKKTKTSTTVKATESKLGKKELKSPAKETYSKSRRRQNGKHKKNSVRTPKRKKLRKQIEKGDIRGTPDYPNQVK